MCARHWGHSGDLGTQTPHQKGSQDITPGRGRRAREGNEARLGRDRAFRGSDIGSESWRGVTWPMQRPCGGVGWLGGRGPIRKGLSPEQGGEGVGGTRTECPIIRVGQEEGPLPPPSVLPAQDRMCQEERPAVPAPGGWSSSGRVSERQPSLAPSQRMQAENRRWHPTRLSPLTLVGGPGQEKERQRQ